MGYEPNVVRNFFNFTKSWNTYYPLNITILFDRFHRSLDAVTSDRYEPD